MRIQNPGVYYPRTQAALIAGPRPGSTDFLREPLQWGTTTSSFLIPDNTPVYFSVELSGGRVAVAELGAAELSRIGIGTLAVRLTSENRNAIFGGDFQIPIELSTAIHDTSEATLMQRLPRRVATDNNQYPRIC